MKRILLISMFFVVQAVISSVSNSFVYGQQAGPMETQQGQRQTLINLKAAYNDQMNLKEKYTAYAAKADQEGYKKANQLFKAAARSVGVHAGLLAKSIIEVGGSPEAHINDTAVRSTRENLEEALKNEGNKIEMTYPSYLDQANKDNTSTAQTTFRSGQRVEFSRKVFLEQASRNLEAWKAPSMNGFYVCTDCGNLVDNLNFSSCPVCQASASKFEQFQ